MPQTKSKKSATTGSDSSNNRSGAKSKSSGRATKAGEGSKSGGQQQQGVGGPMLEKFMYDSLKDIYWAEKHLTKALPKLSKAATNEQLVSALEEHLEMTEEHVARLERVFELLGKKAQAKKCEAMEGLTKEAESIVEETEEGTSTRDVGIIMAAQKVEHYEIATYGGLAQLAKTMGLTEVAELLGQTLQEEKETDENLTSIAENDINLQAEEEGEEEAED
ncbi:MAG TPA: ferritin-like domain-containing protein [Flavitalea sp.]|nr:ferritin-like domain-containing protein [Flavitalea sp.]